MIHRTLRLPAPDGAIIHGDVRLPEGPPPRAAVVVVHGFKGFKDWGFFPHICTELAGAGFAAVSFNFSRNGIGDRPTAFTELESFARNTYTRELEELRRVLDALTDGSLLARIPDAVGLLGHSRGGADSILLASEDGRVAALATWAAVARLDRWTEATRAEWRHTGRVYVLNSRTGQQMPLDVSLLEDFEAHADRLDVLGAAGSVSVPWLVVHGSDDLTVDLSDAHALVARAEGARLEEIPGTGHTFGVGHPFEKTSVALERALDRTIAHFRQHLGST